MIEIKNLNLKIKNEYILQNINLELPRYGIVSIVGPSGCGKSSLLNCISGLLDYDGDIKIDERNYKDIKRFDDFRIKNIGFVFQDFKLFESESIERNILFPLDASSNVRSHRKLRKCEDLMDVVGLSYKKDDLVKSLSGGQKQRVAIARALVNDPVAILADEPTGSLDEKTSIDIMNILYNISRKALVILVSHDESLVYKYSDKIVKMKDGKIIAIKHRNSNEHEIYLPICKNNISNKTPKIPTRFLFNHTKNSYKQKKGRSLICTFVTSLSLIGVGLSITISNSISKNIKDAYSSIVDSNKITISTKKESNSLLGEYAGTYTEAEEIKKEFPHCIKDIGVTYLTDYETIFKDENSFTLINDYEKVSLNSISARSINEFKWLDDSHPSIYPLDFDSLEEDQVVLGLTYNDVENICKAIRIEKGVEKLSNYLVSNHLYAYFDFANEDWEYSDQQIVEIKGFTLESNCCIYHSNHLWNELMFEERMRFPTSDDLSGGVSVPWEFKKIPYFNCGENTYEFIHELRNSVYSDEYIFEIANKKYYPWLYRDVNPIDINRVLFLINTVEHISLNSISYFYNVSDNIYNPIYGCEKGYSIYPSSLMSGFSNKSYFAFDENSLEQVLDADSNVSYYLNENTDYGEDILEGYFARSKATSVRFKPINNEAINGRKPSAINEIIISKGIAKSLYSGGNVLNKELLFAYTTSEQYLPNDKVYKEYSVNKLKVVGVIDSSELAIYQDSEWMIDYFQLIVGLSSFNLQINTISFEIHNTKSIDTTIKSLSRAFPKYTIMNPMDEISESVNQVCSWIKTILVLFSVFTLIIAILLLTFTNYLYMLDNKKDIGLARCLGIGAKESKKFVIANGLFLGLSSFLVSFIEISFSNIVIEYLLSKSLNVSFTLSLDISSILAMFILSLWFSIISSVLVSKKVTKLNPIEALKT